jgi:hypothetical protein
VLGILDAMPETTDGDPLVGSTSRDIANVRTAFASNPFGEILVGLATMARQLGRPPHAYGLTPLMVYREVEP